MSRQPTSPSPPDDGSWGRTGQRAVRPAVAQATREAVGTRFGEAAAVYDRVRPRYPNAVYDWLAEEVMAPVRCADVGAGTGIFGTGMRDRGWSVVGIDPDQDLLALHPEPARGGTAEALPLDDESVDLVTVAQAWHWIDPIPAAAEFRRVLTRTGAVAIVLNQLDVRVEWVLRLARIMHAGDVYRPAWRPALAGFADPTAAEFTFTTGVSADDVVELAATRSYWLRSGPRVRERVEANIRSFLSDEGRGLAAESGSLLTAAGEPDMFELPYLCLAYLTQRRS